MLQNTGRTHFKKGNTPWHKGRTGVYSADALERMSKDRKGRKNPHTLEQDKKIGDSQRGEKGHNWKGGVYKTNNDARRSGEYKYWRKSCLERDGFACQKYETTKTRLVVHHISNFSDFPELRYEISNGITLSIKAHNEFHKKYGKTGNTKDQLIEFLSNE